MNNAVLSSAVGKNPAGTRVAPKIGKSAMQKIDTVVDPETSDRKLSRLCWEVAEALDQQDPARVEYVTIRAAKAAGRYAVFMGFDVEVPAVADPLLEAIRSYQSALHEFNCRAAGLSDEEIDALSERTYAPLLAKLDQWESPATTFEGAVAALRLSMTDKGGVADSETAGRMIKAALGYLEGAM